MKEAFVKKLETQLSEWESAVGALASKADNDVHVLLEEWKTKRDAAVKKLEELKSAGSERWDILKMGVESAWDELRAAFETATTKSARGKESTPNQNAG
jgi:hypothetical protein